MMGQIVVGIDGSPFSLTAFKYALALAKRIKAEEAQSATEVKVVFVVDSRKTELPIIYTASHLDYGFERVYIPPEPGLKDFYEKIRKDIGSFAEKCLAQTKKEADEAGVAVSTVLREGLPSGILTEEARSGDILAIGQKGENARFDRAIVGSTTEDVVRSSPRPVLVCTREYREFKRLLFAYDGSPAAESALQFCAAGLCSIWKDVVILSVTEDIEESFPLEAELSYFSTHGIPHRFIREKGRPADVIPRVAAQEEADLILIGAHGTHKIREYLLGPTAAHLIRRSELPVLVVP